jgi:hydrogenase-4 membrane subunit HyfE
MNPPHLRNRFAAHHAHGRADAGGAIAAGRAAHAAHQHPALRAAIAVSGGIAAVVAYFTTPAHVYVVAVLTLIGKVFFLPWLLNRQVRRIKIDQEIEPLLNAPASMLICGGLTLLGYLVARPFTSLERLGNNTLASPSRSC